MSEVPQPPWRLAPRSSPRTPLSRDAIVEAALRVLDAEGMDGLSMRRVGEALGTGAASLYWHVRNKEELFQLIFERVSAEVELPEPDPARWREQLAELAERMRGVLASHRDVARLSLGRIPAGTVLSVSTEWLFSLLQPVGIPDRVIAYLGDLFGLYVGAYAFEESLGISSPTGEDLPPEQIVEMFRSYVLSLPEDRFPRMRAAVDLLFSGGSDVRFAFGVEVILRGIASYADDANDKGRTGDAGAD
jgi:AcrR family transcriptional regulator